jgi:hypothetical protein
VRREPRFQTLSEVHLKYEGWPNELSVRPPDLSAHGMFVNTTTHFPEGAVVKLRFRLTGLNGEVQTRCELRHCLPGAGIGVEFVRLKSEAAQAIQTELRNVSRLRHAKGPRKTA